LADVPVYDVRYFKPGVNPAGYVIHGQVSRLKDSFLIAIGPLIVNSLLCAVITYTAVLPIFILSAANVSPIFLFNLWIGLSIGMHAFPSNEDARNFVMQVSGRQHGGLLLIFSKCFVILLRIANALRFFWIDAFYAIGVSLFLPWVTGLL
jgi:hypothetical protein